MASEHETAEDYWRTLYEAAAGRLAEAERDAARYRWLKSHYHAADFFYPDVGSVLIFDMGSQERRVSPDLDWTIDQAMTTPSSAASVIADKSAG